MDFVRIFLLWLSFIILVMGAEFSSVEEAVQALKDPEYTVRESSSNYLWTHAKKEELKGYVADADPEVRYRVKILLQNFESGVSPESPQNIIDLVRQFHDGDRDQKVKVMERLRLEKAYEQIFTLYYFSKDESVKEGLAEKLERLVDIAVKEYVDSGQVLKALKILDYADPTAKNARIWAALVYYYGDSSAQIASLDGAETELEQARLLALYQAVGDAPLATNYAKKIGADSFLVGQKFLEGDFEQYFSWWKTQNAELSINEDFLKCYELRIAGRLDEAEKYYQVFEQKGAKGGVDAFESILHLVGLGQLERAYELSSNAEKREMSGYLEARGRYDEFFSVYGFPKEEEDLSEWIAEHVQSNDWDWWFVNTTTELYALGRVLQELGADAMIDALLAPLWEGVKNEPNARYEFLTQLQGQGYVKAAWKLAEPLFKEAPEGSAKIFLPVTSLAKYTLGLLTEKLPDLTMQEKVLRVLALTSGWVEGEESYAEVLQLLALIEQDCEENPTDEEKEKHLAAAYETLGDKNKALSFMEHEFQKVNSWDAGFKLMHQYIFLDKWDEVGRIAEWMNNEKNTNWFQLDVQKAAILARSGKHQLAEELFSVLDKKALNYPQSFISMIDIIMNVGGSGEEVEYLNKAFLLTTPDEGKGYIWRRLIDSAMKSYKEVGKYRLAALCGEVTILNGLSNAYSNQHLLKGGNAQRFFDQIANMRYNTDLMWAKHYLGKAGDEALAKKYLQGLTKEWNGHGILADEVYPLLREARATNILKESLNAGLAIHKKTLEKYPGSHNLKNTMAWLASRAVMELPLAERLIGEALAQVPKNAAYLDTTAEVSFAMGNREKALGFSKKAWQDSQGIGDGKMIKGQYYHFLNSPLPKAN